MTTPPTPKIKPGHYLEWLLLRAVVAWTRTGDLEQATRRVRNLARLARHLLKNEWGWANTNLSLVYGAQLDPATRHHLATLAFENLFTSYMEGMRIADVELNRIEGLEHLQQALSLNRGIIICGIHLGAWEPALRFLGRHQVPLAVVYRHANNPLSERMFMQLRAEYGIEWIRRDEPRGAVRVLQQGRALGLMVDINNRSGGIVAPFLGIPATTLPGPFKLAAQFRSPVLTGVNTRDPDGRVTIRIAPPLEPPAKGSDDQVASAFITRINQWFEPWIHEYAEQYNWLHARFRTRPDGELWRHSTPVEQLWSSRVAPHPQLAERVRVLVSSP